MDFTYLSTPKGDLYSLTRVGGCKAIAAGLLILGSLPLLVGLAVVMPLLAHSTWHLYRKLVV